MTLIDRSTERRSPVTGGTVPHVGAVSRLYSAITPDDDTTLSRGIVRIRNAAAVLVLCALSAVAGAELADHTAPGLCLYQRCWVELTPRRDGDVTVRRSYPGEPVREATVPGACLRGGPDSAGPQCPSWLYAPAPPVQ